MSWPGIIECGVYLPIPRRIQSQIIKLSKILLSLKTLS